MGVGARLGPLGIRGRGIRARPCAEGLPEPQRPCRHLLLDHLYRDSGRDGVLPDGVHGGGPPLEDLPERGCIGDLGCSGPLLLHARVLGAARHLPHRLPLHRLVDHCTIADGGVLLDPLGGAAHPRRGHVLRLLVGTVVMLAAGYCGEAHLTNAFFGFFVGLCGWGYILFEIFAGEAGSVAKNSNKVGEHVKNSFDTMRFIVTVGWSIYPLGYFFGYLMGQVNDDVLNLVYNLADFVNKIAFCLAIWQSAKNDTHERSGSGGLLA